MCKPRRLRVKTITICPPPSSKVGFHLHFYPFFCNLLDQYGIDPGQLFDFSCKSVCLRRQDNILEAGWAQFYRLHRGRVLKLEELLTVRNVFHYCLADLSPNGWRQVDDDNGVNTISVLLAQFVWPHEATNELRLVF
ncbi:hypothetical protein J1N35_010887 [Gossypium stocksii]|uniref:Uncharacterized protein n=1 Tax=Gossypium stocksii TaxID=47602 RepID=A0A9D3W1A2_9ROSI|nr:hypothetical protein J1N35_010887 [Gossypium stocksii]